MLIRNNVPDNKRIGKFSQLNILANLMTMDLTVDNYSSMKFDLLTYDPFFVYENPYLNGLSKFHTFDKDESKSITKLLIYISKHLRWKEIEKLRYIILDLAYDKEDYVPMVFQLQTVGLGEKSLILLLFLYKSEEGNFILYQNENHKNINVVNGVADSLMELTKSIQ